MFLQAIALIRSIPCLAEPGKIIVVGKPDRQLSQALPYLASLPNVIAYNPTTSSLTLRRQPGLITLNDDRVYLTQVDHIDQGLELLARLKEAINATWENRHALTPVEAPRRLPNHLEVWRLLPQTNCGECGEATCLAFAVALLTHKKSLQRCQTLFTNSEFADQRDLLEHYL
jgi:ArsR family metal-binding transcriptional regulator